MSLFSFKPQNTIAALALVAPIIIVQGVRLLLGAGPHQAGAMVLPGGPQPAPTAAVPSPNGTALALTPAQRAAVTFLREQRTQITVFDTPFNHLAPRAAAVQTGPVITTPTDPGTETVIPPEVRSLSLGAVMRNDQGAYAVISGRVRAVGEAVVPGWKLAAIDPDHRRVTLTADDGTTVTLSNEQEPAR
ncbi:MAG: hypothetical protein K2Q09_07395 [Phycisphaerales bacterium]|nr:hypothetical protein [Phycisphaerales bacterium]